jgi:hypothetical protein
MDNGRLLAQALAGLKPKKRIKVGYYGPRLWKWINPRARKRIQQYEQERVREEKAASTRQQIRHHDRKVRTSNRKPGYGRAWYKGAKHVGLMSVQESVRRNRGGY